MKKIFILIISVLCIITQSFSVRVADVKKAPTNGFVGSKKKKIKKIGFYKPINNYSRKQLLLKQRNSKDSIKQKQPESKQPIFTEAAKKKLHDILDKVAKEMPPKLTKIEPVNPENEFLSPPELKKVQQDSRN